MKNAILFILLITIGGCQPPTPTFEPFDFEIKGFDWDPNPYKFGNFIRDSVISTKGTYYAAWDFSYVGDIENLHKAWDRDANVRDLLPQSKIDSFLSFDPVEAIPYILDYAKDHQIVIINEAHHMPQHRVFTTRLLKGLRKQGFKHLGLETYFASRKTDSTLVSNGYPTLTSGYYTKEPQFGNLMREAIKLDFKIFGYESMGHSNGKEREINQAQNIADYLKSFPDEKLLIHCGFDHGYEGIVGNKWEKAMASRLTEFTEIDPYTINQTTFSERSHKDFEDPYYQLVDVKEPTVFVKEEVHFSRYKKEAWYDVSIFHPRSDPFDRPDWLIYNDRVEVKFNFNEAEIDCPCLVFAYVDGEEIGSAVPYDVQSCEEKEVTLILDKENYNIIIWNEEGEALRSFVKRD